MPVTRIHCLVIDLSKINCEILKQVIAGDEGVCVGQACRARLSITNVALRADRSNRAHVVASFFRQPHQRGVVRVVESRNAVARITIDTKGGERIRARINRGGVTAGAAKTKFFFVPRRRTTACFIDNTPFINIRPEHCLKVENRELSIAALLEEAHAVPAAEEVSDLVYHT